MPLVKKNEVNKLSAENGNHSHSSSFFLKKKSKQNRVQATNVAKRTHRQGEQVWAKLGPPAIYTHTARG